MLGKLKVGPKIIAQWFLANMSNFESCPYEDVSLPFSLN